LQKPCKKPWKKPWKKPCKKLVWLVILQGPMLWFFKYFRQKIQRENWRFWLQNKAKICKFFIITLVFLEKRQFFRRKLSKIAENCDHNIDPSNKRVARWHIFKPKILIWVSFGGTCNGSGWYILWPLGLFYGHLVYFVPIG
jgi:hypothetical protein